MKKILILLAFGFYGCGGSFSGGTLQPTIANTGYVVKATACNNLPANKDILWLSFGPAPNLYFDTTELISDDCYLRTVGTYVFSGNTIVLTETKGQFLPLGCSNASLPALGSRTMTLNPTDNSRILILNYTNRTSQSCVSNIENSR